MTSILAVLVPACGAAAWLYATVGHGGASAYLAFFALAGLPQAQMVSTALSLNLLVTVGGFVNYLRAGHFNPRLFIPFAIASVPAAFLGGLVVLPPRLFSGVLAAALLAASARMFLLPLLTGPGGASQGLVGASAAPTVAAMLFVGALLGFLAGLVGVGGGIFLSPLLLVLGWAGQKQTAAVSSAFITVNSAAGLVARLGVRGEPLWAGFWPIAAAVFAGGAIGSWAGAVRFSPLLLQRLLGSVLLLAALKLLVPVALKIMRSV